MVDNNAEQVCSRCGAKLGHLGKTWRGCAVCVNMADDAVELILNHFPERRARVQDAKAKEAAER